MNTLTSLPKSTLITLALLILVTIVAIGNVVSGYTEPNANPPLGNVVAPMR